MDWYFKNDFEYDWCVTALDCAKTDLQHMANARWLIFGQMADSLLEATVRFLHFASLRLQLNFTLDVLVSEEDCDVAAQSLPFAAVRNIDCQDATLTADYCLSCGYAQQAVIRDADRERMRKFWRQIARPVRRGICVSNAQVYNPYHYPFVAAEGEFQQETQDPICLFARTAEKLVTQAQSSYIILRPGAILGAGLNLASPVTDLLDKLIRHDPIGECSPLTKYSAVYITDFLTALIRAAATDRANTAYNIASEESTVSLLRIFELYAENDSSVRLQLQTDACCRSFALDGAKLRSIGWQPLVDLKTMVAMETAARRGAVNGMCFADGYHGKLQAIQSVLFQILCQIDRICKKHRIPYFLAGGTLLGAVRHQGFIPWDDDLDVMMLRPDYERFLAVAPSELPHNLFLQTPATEEGNHYLISKIRMTDTVFSSEYLMNFPKLHNGIFVDVIAQDYTANSVLGQKLHMKLSLLARGLLFKKWSGGSAAAVKGKGYAIFDTIKNVFSFRDLERFQNWALTLFAKRSNRKYLYDSMGINIAKGVYPAQWLAGSVNVTFCGQEFPAPAEYDHYLRYLYGDYMRPVPVTQRRCVHAAPWVDLGPYTEAPAAAETEAAYI